MDASLDRLWHRLSESRPGRVVMHWASSAVLVGAVLAVAALRAELR